MSQRSFFFLPHPEAIVDRPIETILKLDEVFLKFQNHKVNFAEINYGVMLRQLATRQNFITKFEGPCSHCQSAFSSMSRWHRSKSDNSITCETCYAYAQKYGKPRSEELISKRKLQGPCSNCAASRPYGSEKPSRVMWRQIDDGPVLCAVCAQYEERNGNPRPKALIEKTENAWYRLPETSQRTLEAKGVCHGCSVMESPLGWIRYEDDKSLCNDCSLSLNGCEEFTSTKRIDENFRLKKYLLRGPCSNCLTETSTRWCRDKDGSPLCQTCGNYVSNHDGKHRSAELIAKSKRRGEGVMSQEKLEGPCCHCAAKVSSRFVKEKNGDLHCSTCYNYLHSNGRPRPMEIIIRHRQKTERLEKERIEDAQDHVSPPAAKRQRKM